MTKGTDMPVALYYDRSSERQAKAADDIRDALTREGVEFHYGPNNLGDGLGGMTLLVIGNENYTPSMIEQFGQDVVVGIAKSASRIGRSKASVDVSPRIAMGIDEHCPSRR